jgi:hypothetical protein
VLGPTQVPFSFTGPPSRMRQLRRLLRAGELRVAVSLNAPEGLSGQTSVLETVRIDAGDIHPPAGVTSLVTEGRNHLPVRFHRLIERRLPVRLDYTGEKRISQVVFEPGTVSVRGPQETLDHVRSIPTQPFALLSTHETAADTRDLTADAVPLVTQLDGRGVRVTPATVSVRVVCEPPQKAFEVADVPVRFLCPANFRLRPLFSEEGAGRIMLRLLGPAGEEPPAVIAFIDLTGRSWKPGPYEEPVKLQLPANYQLAQPAPRRLAFQLVPLDVQTRP